MRILLDRLYQIAGLLAGFCIVAMAVLILGQIVGRWFGIIVPSTEDFSGYLLAAASFLALPFTLRSGGHIRVNLLISQLHGVKRKVTETLVLLLSLLFSGFAASSAIQLVVESWRFGDISQGYVSVPLWIPQVPMALGLVILTIALLDETVALRSGKQPQYLQHDENLVQSTQNTVE
ncbi:MAG TPA: TRAP transporter small permease subunit [Gammaproteobacteria bacterium]|nr:TRAP transporter small permease subunit [Gammaproteobacteria bacterium]